jgi:hypothetical protein
MEKKNDIQFGAKDVLDSHEYDPGDAKVMISIRVDGDVLKLFKERAEAEGIGYQTLMNRALRLAAHPSRPGLRASSDAQASRLASFRSEIKRAVATEMKALLQRDPAGRKLMAPKARKKKSSSGKKAR